MDFDLSDDQLELRKGAAALLDAMAAPARVRLVADGPEHVDAELWSAMADQGWTAVEAPPEVGGLGLGAVEAAVLCEEIGRHVAPVPFTGTLLAAGALRRAGQWDSWAGRLESGEAIGALGWSDSDDALSATPDGDRWLISGRTGPFVFAPSADVVVISAATVQGQALFAVAGAKAEPEPAMDRTRAVGRCVFDQEPALRLGGPEALQAVIDRAAVAVCAEMLGAADQVLAMTVAYAKDRVQFGRAIGSFQAVKHRCADMLVDVEGMRSVTYYGAWAVGAGDPDASAAASAAKVWCSDASRRVMGSALQ
ncbi:MAG TPA: acyl-CoA dehydrogenase family protein, partial [Acidimicrobiales bacterium]|nr:acyl-CoA dehydrogenase family protein [Acidimicrobiales bacterium]